MAEDFIATHKITTDAGEILVRSDVKDKYTDREGNLHKWNKDTLSVLPSPVLIKAQKLVEDLVITHEGGTEAKLRVTVMVQANAVFAALKAASWPEWENAHGHGESCRGDSANVLHGKGPNGEKIVRVCQISPGRVTDFFDILVGEYLEFEVAE